MKFSLIWKIFKLIFSEKNSLIFVKLEFLKFEDMGERKALNKYYSPDYAADLLNKLNQLLMSPNIEGIPINTTSVKVSSNLGLKRV